MRWSDAKELDLKQVEVSHEDTVRMSEDRKAWSGLVKELGESSSTGYHSITCHSIAETEQTGALSQKTEVPREKLVHSR